MEATTAALVVISLMLILKVVTWDDITANKSAWNTLAWFATLVALADGLTRVGFVKWFAEADRDATRRRLADRRRAWRCCSSTSSGTTSSRASPRT